MRRPFRFPLQQILCGLFAALGWAGAAFAGERAPSVPLSAKYRQECAACHLAYPPGLLPAASWQRILNNLPRHYGTDASLDPASVRELSAWLEANAGTYKRVREQPASPDPASVRELSAWLGASAGTDKKRVGELPPEDRITRSAWFVRKHDEVPARTWTLPAVKSAANCSACHRQAEQGDFNEHNVRIPR